MIEVTETLRWALVVFTIMTGSDGEQASSHSAPGFYATVEACNDEGKRVLSLVEPREGVAVRFACVPREVLRDDLAMRPQPHH